MRTKNLFIAISLVKLNHSHRKYSRKKFYRRIIPEVKHQVYNQIGIGRLWRHKEEFLTKFNNIFHIFITC